MFDCVTFTQNLKYLYTISFGLPLLCSGSCQSVLVLSVSQVESN